MRRLLVVLVLLTLGAVPGSTAPVGGGAVLLPISLQGTYQPIKGPQFTDELAAVLRKAGMGQNLVRMSEADLQKAGFTTPDHPPSLGVAQGLCQSTGKQFCVWMSLRLSATTSSNGDNLAMSGATRFWAYDSTSGTVVVDSPLGSIHSMGIPVKASPEVLQQATMKLVDQNVKDLALQVVTLVEQKAASVRVDAWQAAGRAREPVPPATPSAAYQAMVQSCKDYASAVGQGDLMATQDALKRAYTTYPTLTGQEKAKIEQDYPGTEAWMNGGVWYGGGYYYPPSPYAPR